MQHKLPNGSFTSNFNNYSHAWQEMADDFIKLTGDKLLLSGFDPDFLFIEGSLSNARTITLPVWFVKLLLENK